MYQISDKLKGSERVLHALGYQPKKPSSLESITSTSQELEFEGQVNREQVANIATDLVILQSDLEHLREKIRACGPQSSRDRYLQDVLRAWKEDHRDLLIRASSFNDGDSGRDRYKYSGGDGLNLAAREHAFDAHQDRSAGGVSGVYMDQRTETDCVHPYQESVSRQPNSDNHGFKTSARSSAGQYEYEAGLKSGNNPKPSSVASREQSFRNEEYFSNSTSADEDSLFIAAQNIPRPNIDELPEPMSFSDDVGYSCLPDEELSMGHIINSRSDDYDDSLIGHEYYAPMPEHPVSWHREDHHGNMEVETESILQPVGEVGGGDRRPADGSKDVMFDDYVVIGTPPSDTSNIGAMMKNGGFKQGNDKDCNSESPTTLRREELLKPQADLPAVSDTYHSMLCEKPGESEDGFTVVDVCKGEGCRGNQRSPIRPVLEEKSSTVKSITKEPLKETSTIMSGKWTCDFCTFINPNNKTVCSICDAKRK